MCKYCGMEGHATNRSKNCKYVGWDIEEVHADIVAIYQAKATEEAVRIATEEALSEVQSEGKCDHLCVCCDVKHLNIFQY